jgi:hypothetical protein
MLVDTDEDLDCYDNPKQVCICEACRAEIDEDIERSPPAELDAHLESLAERTRER